MTSVTFGSDMPVSLVQSYAVDQSVIWAAQVSTIGERSLEVEEDVSARSRGLINYLMRERHGSPFEHNSMTFYVQAPLFVFREFHRHRVGWSYNEESGRYRQLAPHFYSPDSERKLVQVGKTGHYEFVDGTAQQFMAVEYALQRTAREAYKNYEMLLADGVAKEVARMCLPVNIYSSMYATCNARSLMNFLSLRTKSDESQFKSYPQFEIELVARKMEEHFKKLMPITYEAFVSHGRVAP